jgi:hypothetical protein
MNLTKNQLVLKSMKTSKKEVTKTFKRSFGGPVELTMKQYCDEWAKHTGQMFSVFCDADMDKEYFQMQNSVIKAAMLAWQAKEEV